MLALYWTLVQDRPAASGAVAIFSRLAIERILHGLMI
jgi:hypothetical protein